MDATAACRACEPVFDFQLGAWIISRYRDVFAALTDHRFVPTTADARSAENWTEAPSPPKVLRVAAQALGMRLRACLPEFIQSAARMLQEDKPPDLLREFLAPWCFGVAAATVDTPQDKHLVELAERIFRSSAFPFDARLRQDRSAAACDLARALNSNNPLAVQAFVALATSLPQLLATCLVLMLQNPRERERIAVHPALLDGAVEECFRLGCQPSVLLRRAVCDLELSGVTICRKQLVLLMIRSANLDASAFSNPDLFEIERTPNVHLTFGRGAHGCAGAEMVRSVVWPFLLNAIPRLNCITLTETPSWDGFAIQFLNRLTVDFS